MSTRVSYHLHPLLSPSLLLTTLQQVELNIEKGKHSKETVKSALLDLPSISPLSFQSNFFWNANFTDTTIVSVDTHMGKVVVEGPALSSDIVEKLASYGSSLFVCFFLYFVDKEWTQIYTGLGAQVVMVCQNTSIILVQV